MTPPLRVAPGAAHAARSAAPPPLSGAYRAVWRWHFYAGLLVLPVLCLIALTGAIYLFAPEIDGAVYRDLQRVEPRAAAAAPERWIRAAAAGAGGEVTAVTVPLAPDQAARLSVRRPDGAERTAFVDPHDAQLLGVIPHGGVMETVKQLHSLALAGPVGNLLVEVVAGWAIILVATGVFLWWPRGRNVGVAAVRARDPARRPFWRDLHAVTGLYAGGVILFLAVTGMPWSAVWGDQALGWMRASGLGRPPAPGGTSGWHHPGAHPAPEGVGWTMEGVELGSEGAGRGGLSTVIAAADQARLPRPYTVSIPSEPGRAWTVAPEITRAEQARTLYVDGGTGAVLGDARWAEFGTGAKAFEWGIAVHQGQQYGWTNRLVMLGGCVAVWLLAASAVTMWWKRRPHGRLGAPSAPPGPRVRAAVLGIVLPLAILYPLTGLSLLAALAAERVVTLAGGARRRSEGAAA